MKSSKRLWRAIASFFLIVSVGACGSDDRSPGHMYELVEVADDVWATVVREGISPSRYAASLIIVRTDGVVVVDSRHDEAAARDLIETIGDLTDLPVRYVINTHWHGDHVQGNGAFREAFPDVRFVGGATMNSDMLTLGRERLDEEIAQVREDIETAEVMEEELERENGMPLTADERESLPAELERLRERLAALEAVTLVAPGMTTDSELRLDDSEPVVRVIKVGPAHTRGDVIVHLPDLGILALGDLIEDGFPWLGDGYPAGWAAALYRASELDADIFIGAHGPVLRDREMLETQYAFARRLVNHVRTSVRSGMSVEETLEAADLSEFQDHFTRRMAEASEAERTERFEEFVEETLRRAYAEAAGELTLA